MADSYRALCSDAYVNLRLNLKLDLPSARETVLSLFDRVRREFPDMERFRRAPGELALESEAQDGRQRWLSLKKTAIRAGVVNAEDSEEAYALHRLVLEVSPYFLSISPLDVDYLELLYGFDLLAAGNHDAIVFDALVADTPLGRLAELGRAGGPASSNGRGSGGKGTTGGTFPPPPGAAPNAGGGTGGAAGVGGGAGPGGGRGAKSEERSPAGSPGDEPTPLGPLLDCQPIVGVALNDACDLQAHFEVKTRTAARHVRTSEFAGQPISVYLTLRKYGSVADVKGLLESFESLAAHGERVVDDKVIPFLLRPIRESILAAGA